MNTALNDWHKYTLYEYNVQVHLKIKRLKFTLLGRHYSLRMRVLNKNKWLGAIKELRQVTVVNVS